MRPLWRESEYVHLDDTLEEIWMWEGLIRMWKREGGIPDRENSQVKHRHLYPHCTEVSGCLHWTKEVVYCCGHQGSGIQSSQKGLSPGDCSAHVLPQFLLANPRHFLLDCKVLIKITKWTTSHFLLIFNCHPNDACYWMCQISLALNFNSLWNWLHSVSFPQ